MKSGNYLFHIFPSAAYTQIPTKFFIEVFKGLTY